MNGCEWKRLTPLGEEEAGRIGDSHLGHLGVAGGQGGKGGR
jgi:hypothetical protein